MSDLLPNNATKEEQAIAETIVRLSAVPVPIRDVWDADTAPSDILPWLAWAYSVDDWSSEWTDEQKRQAIKTSIQVHRYKGTVGAVTEALAALGIEVHLREWFQMDPPGAPYTFDLVLDAQQEPIDQAAMASLESTVWAAKNLRSHMGNIRPGATVNSNLYFAAAAGAGLEITIEYGGGNLRADGTVFADGTYRANGIKFNA